jgi:hypothetical protein
MSTPSHRTDRCRACGGRIVIGQQPSDWAVLMGGVLVHYGRGWTCREDYARGARAAEPGDVF